MSRDSTSTTSPQEPLAVFLNVNTILHQANEPNDAPPVPPQLVRQNGTRFRRSPVENSTTKSTFD